MYSTFASFDTDSKPHLGLDFDLDILTYEYALKLFILFNSYDPVLCFLHPSVYINLYNPANNNLKHLVCYEAQK